MSLQLADRLQSLTVRPMPTSVFMNRNNVPTPASPTAKRIARSEAEKRVETRRRAFRTAGKSRSLGENGVLTAVSSSQSVAPPPASSRVSVSRSDSVQQRHPRRHHQLQPSNTGQQQPSPSPMRKSSDVIYGSGKQRNQPAVDEDGAISAQAQQIIQFCLENARGDLSARVLSRMAHKRPDFAHFCNQLGAEHATLFGDQFRQYLADVVGSLQSTEKIRLLSAQFGANQVGWRTHGFKADFFAEMASALTMECVFLDGAAHPPTDAFEAWAGLVELMFSAVRDGYYTHVRKLRRSNFSLGYSQSMMVQQRKESMPAAAAVGSNRQQQGGYQQKGRASRRGDVAGGHYSLEF